MLMHTVFFNLNDSSPAAIDELVNNCNQYLKDHPGVVYFAVGKLAPEFTRPVNDLEFSVGLNIGFADKAAHDVYQNAPLHNQFIELSKGNWKQVRVFDYWC